MVETEVSVENGDVRLAGTLVRPDAPRGTVIFVHGSGPLDRNQNTRRQRLNVFNALADALADAGYASIRYDKRGVGASGGTYKTHGYDDLVGDLRAWVAFAEADPGLGPVYLCGHSEGTLLAAKAARDGAGVAGLILLAPFVTDGATILRRQAQEGEAFVAGLKGVGGFIARTINRITGGPAHMQERMIRRVLGSEKPVIFALGRRMGVRWLRDFLTWDAAEIYRGLATPMLVIVAGQDRQCPPEDGATIAAMASNATLRRYPDLSHLLRRTSPNAGFSDYSEQLKLPVDTAVAEGMLSWLEDQRGRSAG